MWLTSLPALSLGPHISCPMLWCFEVSSLNSWTHFHNLMLLWVGPDEKFGLDGQFLTVLLRLLCEIMNWKWQRREFFSFTIVQSLYLPISVDLSFSRWHWRSDGAVYRSQCFNNTRNIWLPVWGKVMLWFFKHSFCFCINLYTKLHELYGVICSSL